MHEVCFLNGHLILREHKTGVHNFHEQVTKKIIEKDRKFKPVVAYFENEESTKVIKKEENDWITPYCKTRPKWMRILSYILPIELFFGKNEVYFCDGLFPICLNKSIRICLVHDMMVKVYPENYSTIKKIYLNHFFKKLPKADLIICVSETTKNDIVKYYNVDPNRIVVCYNGVNFVESNSKNIQRDNDSIDLSKRYLFYLGDMRKNKNLPGTVRGFLKFCEKNHINDLFFYVAGKKNEDYVNVLKVISESEYGTQVRFLGYISDDEKDFLYQNCESVILLSYYEGFGMPIVEGMSYYKPVITSNCSSMKEVGEGVVLLANPNNVDDICGAIENVYYKTFIVDQKKYKDKLKVYNFNNVAKIINESIERLLEERL